MKSLAIKLSYFSCIVLMSFTVQANCSLASNPLNFGRYDVFNNFDTTSRGTLEVNCNEAIAYRLKLSTGAGSYQRRYLQNGVDVLEYNLYKDASFQTIWADGSYADDQTFIHNGAMKYDVHAKISAGQNVSVGAYSDVIVVTLEY